jgi:predicted nucleic acid-binding protein
MPYLLDTGILLRLFDRRDPEHVTIREAVARIKVRGEELLTTSQNIGELWNVSTRPASARGGYGLSVQIVERRVAFLERQCRILFDDDACYSEWKRLLSTYNVTGVSVHDARVVAVMVRWGVTQLVTLNAEDFRRYQGIVVRTPAELVASLAEAR